MCLHGLLNPGPTVPFIMNTLPSTEAVVASVARTPAATPSRARSPLYFVSAPVDVALIGGLAIALFVFLKLQRSASVSLYVTAAAYLSGSSTGRTSRRRSTASITRARTSASIR